MIDRPLHLLRARMLRAAGLAPATLALAAGCADEGGELTLATPAADEPTAVLTEVGRGLASTDAAIRPPMERSLRVHTLPVLVADHVHWIRVDGAPPEAELVAELRADGKVLEVGLGYADRDGIAEVPVVFPEIPRLIDLEVELGMIATGPSGRQVDGSARFVLAAALTEHPDLDLLHPGVASTLELAGGDYRACAPAPAEGCSAPDDFHTWEGRQVVAWALDASLPPELDVAACEADAAPAGSCCYTVNLGFKGQAPQPQCPQDATDWYGYWYDYEGRPFAGSDGQPREAERVARRWAAPLDALPLPTEPALRAHVADAWRRTASAEHASIASFARFQLELLALGAPADLLARAARAIADETRHAELAFAVASRLDGPVGPGPLDLGDTMARVTDPIAVIVGAIVEGCINETLAAAQVRRAADHADPVLAPRLTAVADDEAAHAELAWAFVRWMLTTRPSLAPVVRDTFARFRLPEPPADDGPDGRRWGVLGERERLVLSHQVLDRVIRPCAEALVAAC